MKCMRRPDLDPQTRLQMVMTAWLHQGVYGTMTNIAKFYQIYLAAQIMPRTMRL